MSTAEVARSQSIEPEKEQAKASIHPLSEKIHNLLPKLPENFWSKLAKVLILRIEDWRYLPRSIREVCFNCGENNELNKLEFNDLRDDIKRFLSRNHKEAA